MLSRRRNFHWWKLATCESYFLLKTPVLSVACSRESHWWWGQTIWKLCKTPFIFREWQRNRAIYTKMSDSNNRSISNLLFRCRISSHNNIWIYNKQGKVKWASSMNYKKQVYSSAKIFIRATLLCLHIWFGNTSKACEL